MLKLLACSEDMERHYATSNQMMVKHKVYLPYLPSITVSSKYMLQGEGNADMELTVM